MLKLPKSGLNDKSVQVNMTYDLIYIFLLNVKSKRIYEFSSNMIFRVGIFLD